MGQSDRIRDFYLRHLDQGLARLTAEMDLDALEHEQVVLLHRLCSALVDAFFASVGERGPDLDTSTSVMYAAAQPSASRVLDVPLRSLVESGTLTPQQARLLGGAIASRRTVLISGPADSGRSTLLNALLYLLPRDLDVAAAHPEPGLPALRGRPFTLSICAPPGSPAMTTALQRAAATSPGCLVADDLASGEALTFLGAVAPAGLGLATVDSPDPEVSLADWLSTSRQAATLLVERRPWLVYMERDQAGRPRVRRLLEIRPGRDGPILGDLKTE